MSTESLNRTPENFETPSISEGVLNRELNSASRKPIIVSKKRTCVNDLNQRLYTSQKKDKIRNRVIIFTIFFSVGIIGFIVG